MDKKKKSNPKKKGAPKLNDLDVKQRRLAILKQKHCDAVALHIVGKLIDSSVEEDVFLQSLKYLNQCHFEDIIEERAISKMCGYPICKNMIPDMPAKKYHISVKSNKVYDITERKNYCSNFCYAAGNHIKLQMLTSPLWYRDQEEIPNFQLLEKDVKGTPGEEIDQGILRVPKENDPEFTSILQFTEDVVNDLPNDYINDECENDTDEEITSNINKLSISTESKKRNIVIDNSKPSTSKDGLTSENYEENLENVTNHTLSKNEMIVTNIGTIETNSYNDENFFYSKMFIPSLADILNENAKYFENIDKTFEKNKTGDNKNKTGDNNNKIDNNVNNKIANGNIKNKMKQNSIKNSTEENKNKNELVENKNGKNENKSDVNRNESSENKNESVKTIVVEENKTDDKPILKGILSKKNKGKLKKNVKFAFEQLAADTLGSDTNENTRTTRIFKKPCVPKNLVKNKEMNNMENKTNNNTNENINNTKKNIKLENNDLITKTDNKENEITNSERQINEEHVKHLSQNSLINKPVIEHKSVVISNQNQEAKIDSEKEKRKSRFKNSATYARAKHLSKVDLPKDEPKIVFQEHIEKCIKEWCTIETMIYLYGEERVQNIISDKKFKQYINYKKNSEEEERRKKQYNSLCKRLNLMELADKQYDENVKSKEKKPPPNYNQLKEEAETMDLKVQAFYSGCFEVYEVEDDESGIKEEETPEVVKGPPAVLPLIDNKDYDPIRKKIFLNSLSRTIPNICEIFQLSSPNLLMMDLKELVSTFKFGANNIIFKSLEWPLVTFLLLKMISIKKSEFLDFLSREKVQNYISSILNPLKINKDDFYSNILKIIDINTVLQDYLNKNNDDA